MFAPVPFRMRVASILVAAVMIAGAVPALAQVRPANAVVSVSRPATAAVPENPRAVIAQFATGHMLTSDHIYRSRGAAIEIVPIWNQEAAVITSSGTLADGQWRIHLRTQSGIEGFVDLAHPSQLSHILKPIK